MPLLQFLVDRELLEYTAHEAILCHSAFTNWLQHDNHAARIVIGKFAQGANEGEKHMQRRLITDTGALPTDHGISRAMGYAIRRKVERYMLLSGP